MLKKLATVSALATVLSAAPALAQQTPGDEQQPPAATQLRPAMPEQPQAGQGAAMGDLVGLEVYSSDGQRLGEVTKANQGADGKIESIHIDISTFLGLGSKTVEVRAEQFTETENGIELTLNAADADALPEVKAE